MNRIPHLLCLVLLAITASGCTVGTSQPAEQVTPSASTAAKTIDAPPTKDIRLLHLRRLAVEVPITEFVEQWNTWFAWFHVDYHDDRMLWYGVDRLAQWALANEPQASEQLAMSLLFSVPGDPRGETSYLTQQRDALKQLRQRKRSVQVAAATRTS
jgi:hypothetical protein